MELPQLLAGLDVEKRQDEENCGERQHEQILHSKSPKKFAAPAGTGLESLLLFQPETYSGLWMVGVAQRFPK
jgi:hypothetical protein